jgi:predicted HicB family RNase H-like nuclease
MKKTISTTIEENIIKEAKIEAIKHNQKINEYIEKAIEEYIKNHRGEN